MSNPESDADKIRTKRLAKLQAQIQQKQTHNEGVIPAVSSASQLRQQSSGNSPELQPVETDEIVSASSKLLGSHPRNLNPPTPSNSPIPAFKRDRQTLEEWEDRALSQIFRITLQPGAYGNDMLYLEKLRQELEEEGEEPLLSTRILDQVILVLCSSHCIKVSPFEYLLASWKRASSALRNLKPTSSHHQHKIFVYQEAKRMCLSYSIYCVTMPEMFENVDASVNLDLQKLIDPEDFNVSLDYLQELVGNFQEEPVLKEAFANAIRNLSAAMRSVDLGDDYRSYLTALKGIVSVKALADILVEDSAFLPKDLTAANVEFQTILGPFFRLSPLQPKVVEQYFAGSKTKPPTAIADATRALQSTTRNVQDELLHITNVLLRSSKAAKNKVLDFFATVMNLNDKRTALQVESGTVSSDAFMLNVASVLTRLCEPFMDTAFEGVKKVSVKYFRHGPRLDISHETKLNADAQQAELYYAKKLEGEPNFISEVFFLTVAAYHYGLVACQQSHAQLSQDIYEMEKNLDLLQAERAKWLNTPQLPTWDRRLEEFRKRLDIGMAYKLALEAALFDQNLQQRTLHFMRFFTMWILRLVSPDRNYPQTPLSLPLPEEPPEEFSMLPEYFVENIASCFGFIGRSLPHIILGTQVEELVTFCITFLRSTKYIHNPHLKSKLVEILYYGIQPNRSKPNGSLGDAINSLQFALKYLMHALMTFYIEIESQYYQKFTVRYHISQIIQRMWDNTLYRAKLEQESRLNVDFFVRFVALLLNDVTYVMDNSLTALQEINSLQKELEGPAASTMSEQAKQEKEEKLTKAQKDASSYMTLGNETVLMLKLFTAALADAFVQPEVVHRLAGMLDYNLEALVGPKCRDLNVRDPEKYGFRPRVLLADICDVYLNLRNKPEFIEAIAKDGRSYKPELFTGTDRILTKFELKSPEHRAELLKLGQEVAKVKQMMDEGEEELGEIPDEFLDPLMATLMVDPVILPSSRVTVDRQTISTHLLSDPKDPFNRAPLKIEDVIPNTELKAQIEAFIQERRGKSLSGDVMEI